MLVIGPIPGKTMLPRRISTRLVLGRRVERVADLFVEGEEQVFHLIERIVALFGQPHWIGQGPMPYVTVLLPCQPAVASPTLGGRSTPHRLRRDSARRRTEASVLLPRGSASHRCGCRLDRGRHDSGYLR
jgi:hypothetical protein